MKRIVLFKKFLSALIILSIFSNFFFPTLNAIETNWLANPWTLQKAKHLASRVLIWPNPDIIKTLYDAWSAQNAVNILFPSVNWPDRSAFLADLETFKWPSFNISDTNQNRQVYAYKYYKDPYEAKAKLFWLFEDIFPVDRNWTNSDNINFPDVENHFKILYEETLWNYKKMVKRVLFDTQNPENSFAMWKYLDLLNQPNKDYPNENYARELMQLFLMLEYKPREDAETPNAIRNYTEEDVAYLAKILTWFRAWVDKKVYFDLSNHNNSNAIAFLSWDLKTWDSFPFYNSASWTINNNLIIEPIWWNNWLWDNILDYIFSKREAEIAYFLSWRLLKYYTFNKPTQSEIESLANQLLQNNFEIFPTVKWLLSSDMMYSDKSMNELRYKTPIEFTIWTLKLLHYKNPKLDIDPLIRDTTLLTNFDWVPYNPRSIFGRDWFDNNSNFMNAYFHNTWVTYSSKIAFTSSAWSYDLADLVPISRYTNTWTIDLKTSNLNNYSGSIDLSNITIVLKENIFPAVAEVSSFSDEKSNNLIESLGENTIDSDIEFIEDVISLDKEILEQNDTENNSWEILEQKEENILNQETENQKPEILEQNDTEDNSWEILEVEIDLTQPIEEESKVEEKTIQELKENKDLLNLNSFNFRDFFLPKANAEILSPNTITFSTWKIVFPDFYIQTSSWKINLEGSFNSETWNLIMSSWSFLYGSWVYSIQNFSYNVKPWFVFERDITIDEMIRDFEDYLYLWKRLPEEVKTEIKTFLLKDQTWKDRLFLPNNTTYRNKYIKAVISMMLIQPEFMMISWYDLPTSLENSWTTQINDETKKLIMIELYGWYDWINWIIPKTWFDYYNQIRWGLAINEENLIDLWEVYLNKNLESFKPYFDSWELRIVNRVWTPNHSRWHDTAAIQVASQKALQTVWTPGLIWELIKNETNPLNHIVLWTNKPPIYTNWKYINIGWWSILYKNNISGTTQAEKDYQILTIKRILNSRQYPEKTTSNFTNSITLDTVWNTWQSSVWSSLNSRLNFTKWLIENWLWITYYIPWWGWYDTHWDQLKSWSYNLNDRTRDLALEITNFFSQMKAQNKDVTIVVYSEFWRTLKANWTVWTDHGQWWGYFILSTNNALKTSIPQKVVWKIDLQKEYNDWLWVWVDYRSIYSKILKSLYNVDVNSYFLKDYNLEDDLNTETPNPVLKRNEYRNSYNNYVNLDLKFTFDDTNFRFKDGSYLKFYYWEDINNLRQFSKWQMDNYTLQKDSSFKINLNLPRQRNYFYRLEVVDNQYDTYISTWSFITPTKYEANSSNNVIPLNSDSFFAKYNNTSVSWNKTIDKLVLYNNPVEEIVFSWATSTGIIFSWSLKDISFNDSIVLTFWTGETFIDTLTHSWVWNWGFVTPKFIKKQEFITKNAVFSWSSLKNLHIENILKVWSDVLWVWMKLNQNVKISLPILSSTWTYKVITSEDWINWIEVNNVIQNWNNLSFNTNHFSYFALYNTKNITTTPVNPPKNWWNGNNSGNNNNNNWWNTNNNWWSTQVIKNSGWWGWWSSWIMKDYCPNWDFSKSYYDWKCDFDNFSEDKTKNTQTTKKIIDKEYVQDLKKQLLQERMNKSQNDKVKLKNTKIWNFSITEISWYKLSDKTKKLSIRIMNNKKISNSDKQKYINRLNEFLQAKYNFDKDNKNQISKNKYNKQVILLTQVLKKIKKL